MADLSNDKATQCSPEKMELTLELARRGKLDQHGKLLESIRNETMRHNIESGMTDSDSKKMIDDAQKNIDRCFNKANRRQSV